VPRFCTLRALLCCACTIVCSLCVAQSTTSASLAGTVSAPDGSLIAAASVTLVQPDGPAHTVSTDGLGTFYLQDLPSATYSLRVTAPGFAAYEQSSVVVATGRTTHVAVQLALPTANASLTVTAAQTSFDPWQTSSVVNIDRDRVEELPIPSRNYLTFVLLSPAVAAGNPVLRQGVPANEPTFSFGGLRPGSNAVYLDGSTDSDEFHGGSRTQLSPEAISDFQIVNHGFQPQSGGAAGGSMDVQSRVGLNRIHGDAFTFVQNGGLNGTQPLERVPRKPDESRMRAGVALGGPILRDRTFYYVAAEQELARGEDASDFSPTTLAALNSAVRLYPPLAPLTLQSGFFPTTDQETELSARIDQKLTGAHSLMLRYAFTNTRNVNDAFNTDEFSDRTVRGSSFTADYSLNGTLTSTLSHSALNQFSFEVAQRRALNRTANSTGPGILIPSVALFGAPYFGNDRHFETHTEFSDAASLQRSQHLLQAGARVDRVAVRADTPDAAHGLFVFPTLAAFQSGSADLFTQSFGNFRTNFAETRIAAYAQDHWTATKRLTLDYGLRYDANLLPSPVPQDAVNLSPRIGAAFIPTHSLAIRAGFGLFFDRYLLATINRVLQQDGTHAFTQIVEDTAAAAIYRSDAVTAPLPAIAPSIWRARPKLRNPYSEVASLSLEQALPFQSTLTGEYQFVRGVHLGRSTNINLAPPVTLAATNAASLGISAPAAQQLGRPVFSPLRLNPAFDAINQFATTASSTYHGATITLNRQFQEDMQVMAGYTFSKTIDDASSDAEQPQDPYDLAAERALALEDQRHRFTLSGLWLIGPDLDDPADAAKAANPGPLMKALTGLEFAPILTVSSGFRTNPVTGLDTTREHVFPFAARPSGYARNSLATPAQVNLDLRVLRIVPLGRGHLDVVAESFNLLNHRNVSLNNPVYGTGAPPAPNFNRPMATFSARRIQFSLDYEF
jgi:hypothetical protein